MRAISIGFHEVVEDGVCPQPIAPGHSILYTIARHDFRTCLEAIRTRAGAQAADRAIEPEAARHDGPQVILTVDDGCESIYSCVAPELEKLGWFGHFFVTTDWIGKKGFMNAQQIRELHDRGHVIGSHSCTHPDRMSCLCRQDLMREWSESSTVLSDIVGQQVSVASVPGGYYSRPVAQAAAHSGIKVLFTSEPSTGSHMVDGCLVLGRYTVRDTTPAGTVGAIAAGDLSPRFRQAAVWAAKKVVRRIAGRSYVRLRSVLTRRSFAS